MDRITRKGLKEDKFVAEVTHTVEYVSQHRRQMMMYGAIGVAVVLLIGGGWWYRKNQNATRQRQLVETLRIHEAAVSDSTRDEGIRTYASKGEKDKAVAKAWGDLYKAYPGSEEGSIARYYQASLAADRGDLKEAEKGFRDVMQSGNQYASAAQLSLAQVHSVAGRTGEAEKLLRELIARPTILVSKEQATVALARLLAPTKPDEARKLLEPLRTERSAVSRAAITALSDIPAK